MAETTRFGFERVGGAFGGSIADKDSKATATDPQLIDTLLAFFENHRHDGGADPHPLANPTGPATAVTASTGGTIANGVTRYYSYSLIDQFGLETAASPELAVVLPGSTAVEDYPVVVGDNVDGSALPADTYYYALTANTVAGETALGPQTVITIYDDQNQADIHLPDLATGFISWNLWRQSLSEEGWTKVFAGQAGGADIADVGFPSGDCLCDPTTQPPDENSLEGSGTNSIIITPLPADLTGASAWRLYETDTSGSYSTASLVATIVPTAPGGPVPSSYTDTGAALLTGQLLQKSSTLAPSRSVSGGGGGGGGGTGGGGADSHLITAARPMAITNTSVASLFWYGTDGSGLASQIGNDIIAVYDIPGFGDAGDQFQIMTDGVYSISALLDVQGTADAGTVFKVQFSVQPPTGTGVDYTWLTAFQSGQLIVPPGLDYATGNVSMPAVFMPAGTRVTAFLIPYFTGATPTNVVMTLAITMASGTPAGAPVDPAPTITATTSTSNSLTVTWTKRASDDAANMLLLYKDGKRVQVSVEGPGTGSATKTFSGLPADGSGYVVIVMGIKTLTNGATLFSAPAIGTPSGGGGTPGTPASFTRTVTADTITVDTITAGSGAAPDTYVILLMDSTFTSTLGGPATSGVGSVPMATFNGLTAATDYGIRIIAFTGNNASAAPLDTVVTTDAVGGGGSFTPSDAHDDAPELPTATGSVTWDNTSHTDDPPPYNTAAGWHTSWVKFTCTTTGTFSLDVTGFPATGYSGINVYKANGDTFGGTSGAHFAPASDPFVAGTTYYILVLSENPCTPTLTWSVPTA